MYCWKESWKKCFDMHESYKDCIFLQNSRKSYVFKQIFQDLGKKCILAQLAWFESPEISNAEQRCFRDLTFFSADSENIKNISADQL